MISAQKEIALIACPYFQSLLGFFMSFLFIFCLVSICACLCARISLLAFIQSFSCTFLVVLFYFYLQLWEPTDAPLQCVSTSCFTFTFICCRLLALSVGAFQEFTNFITTKSSALLKLFFAKKCSKYLISLTFIHGDLCCIIILSEFCLVDHRRIDMDMYM